MENKLRMKFESRNQSLADLGFISLDLNQLIFFSELLNDGAIEALENNFFNAHGYQLTRHNKLLEEYSNNIRIVDVKNGCIEIIFDGVSLLTSILIPFVALKVSRHLDKKDERLKFEINPEDERLASLINKYSEGLFGKEDKDLSWLFEKLSSEGYSISSNYEDHYVIQKVLDKYEKRIVKIITKY